MNRLSLRVLLFAGCLIISSSHAAAAATPSHLWSQRFGDANRQQGYSVATDASGNVFVTGWFEGTVNFGGGDLTSAGSGDIFVAKFNATGVHQWSQRFGDADQQVATALATDGSGNVIVTGYSFGTVNFGGGDITSAWGGCDVFVVKFDAAGVHQWSQGFGDEGWALGNSVATDGSGNVIVTGYFGLTLNFGGGDFTTAGDPDIFVAKFNSVGVHQWSQRFGDASDQFGGSVATDGSGNVIVTGVFSGTVDFGGGDLTDPFGYGEAFVVKFNAAGVHQWSKQFKVGIGPDGVAADASGNVIITGSFVGTIDFGGGNLTSAGSPDIFLAKFNAAGVHQWSRRFGNYTAEGSSVATDASGSVVLTGRFTGTVDFGGGSLTTAGDGDVYVAAFNAAGAHQWSGRFGGAGEQSGYSVAADGNGNAIVTGYFYESVDFGGGRYR